MCTGTLKGGGFKRETNRVVMGENSVKKTQGEVGKRHKQCLLTNSFSSSSATHKSNEKENKERKRFNHSRRLSHYKKSKLSVTEYLTYLTRCKTNTNRVDW